ncbi:tRNA delta-2-isopentenylpyrophosphate (IPP) transferase [Candidatus Blochmanniella floridana]|uniref:tRNA dimethylallyltransferase n=1 Tax=Blochmanniella floridana TaxID=203907 RepID=MIAA_BLOFL|nr:RecName: Full=tRNA dimethylallyltransferase; AltName: Full=Dimethylallyl diphosphate:tRNA dimethylallyltransferase; Short=DMAPP:tRNA dimethylallyltransferase; Short=DMATase; AltName: Full=Isopentenyl-diphosphate:tRNA isopentenyltransferase; Short=IPP transferase; Short=IPPT; Short=IPTase [Candidatus Blochmannia floridanus]CAD83602.1 tRNA delta-2-isopentenylpyrophosphate (IPP) transferase [Candidatus Blochmannia floridanus]
MRKYFKERDVPFIIFLMGPTASGKTSVVIELKKQKLGIKIISVDSALVYKNMNIGTAKPSVDELEIAPHQLIDIRDPADCYSVSDFYHDAILEINKIIRSGYVPVLVGGTMLYFKTLLTGLYQLPGKSQNIRNDLIYEAQKIGWVNMYNKLKCIDPIVSKTIHCNDHKRIIRALEVFLSSGKTLTELKQKFLNQQSQRYKVLQFALMPSKREFLYNRIEQRFYKMLKSGFEDEVRLLFSRPDLHDGYQSSISCVGYRQMWEYLSGNVEYDQMIYKGIYATRRLVKNQLTWLKKWPNVHWLNGDNVLIAVNDMLSVLSKYSCVI